MALHPKSAVTVFPSAQTTRSVTAEVRCAVRFPLALPMQLHAGRRDFTALTRNVSASGVLFEMANSLRVGERVDFSLRMPAGVLGTAHDVLVDCRGRVVRCSKSQAQSHIAATIDEYQFVEQ